MGEAQLPLGYRSLLFLRHPPEGPWVIIELSQGVYSIRNDERNVLRVQAPASLGSGLELVSNPQGTGVRNDLEGKALPEAFARIRNARASAITKSGNP